MQMFFMWFGVFTFGGLCGIAMVETVWFVGSRLKRKEINKN